jgi:hypothetical protein
VHSEDRDLFLVGRPLPLVDLAAYRSCWNKMLEKSRLDFVNGKKRLAPRGGESNAELEELEDLSMVYRDDFMALVSARW